MFLLISRKMRWRASIKSSLGTSLYGVNSLLMASSCSFVMIVRVFSPALASADKEKFPRNALQVLRLLPDR